MAGSGSATPFRRDSVGAPFPSVGQLLAFAPGVRPRIGGIARAAVPVQHKKRRGISSLWERPGPQAALLRPARGRCRLRPQRARPLTVSPHPCARRSLGPRKVSVRTFQEFGWLAGSPEALSSVRVPTPENDESELLGVDQGASASSASAWPRRSVPGGLEDGPASSHPSPHPGTPPRGRRSKICPRRERAKPPPRDGYPLSRLTDPSIGQSVLREPFAR